MAQLVVAPSALFAQAEAGQGAVRPYIHVYVAYGIAWLLVLMWAWRISRMTKRAAANAPGPQREVPDSGR